MKSAGHYTGIHVTVTKTDEAGNAIEYSDPELVCIPAKLVSTQENGTVTIDILDPAWPLGPQRRTGVLVGPSPVNGEATFHLVEDHA